MKNLLKSTSEARNFEMLFTAITEDEILSVQALKSVRGGDGEAGGGEPIIIVPKGVK
jgi:hypothetical protein